jgi:hypothetical protein
MQTILKVSCGLSPEINLHFKLSFDVDSLSSTSVFSIQWKQIKIEEFARNQRHFKNPSRQFSSKSSAFNAQSIFGELWRYRRKRRNLSNKHELKLVERFKMRKWQHQKEEEMKDKTKLEYEIASDNQFRSNWLARCWIFNELQLDFGFDNWISSDDRKHLRNYSCWQWRDIDWLREI